MLLFVKLNNKVLLNISLNRLFYKKKIIELIKFRKYIKKFNYKVKKFFLLSEKNVLSKKIAEKKRFMFFVFKSFFHHKRTLSKMTRKVSVQVAHVAPFLENRKYVTESDLDLFQFYASYNCFLYESAISFFNLGYWRVRPFLNTVKLVKSKKIQEFLLVIKYRRKNIFLTAVERIRGFAGVQMLHKLSPSALKIVGYERKTRRTFFLLLNSFFRAIKRIFKERKYGKKLNIIEYGIPSLKKTSVILFRNMAYYRFVAGSFEKRNRKAHRPILRKPKRRRG